MNQAFTYVIFIFICIILLLLFHIYIYPLDTAEIKRNVTGHVKHVITKGTGKCILDVWF